MLDVSSKTAYLLTKKQQEVLTEYHLIQAKLRSELGKREAKRVVITSLDEGEGTTTSAANLAILFAKQGNNVLLIDTNIRRPAIHSYFQVENEYGLVSYIKGYNPLDQSIQREILPFLDVMTTGTQLELNASALFSLNTENVFQQLDEEYDYIFIDAPPLLHYPDTMFLANMCDGIVLVCESERHSKKELQRGKRVFEKDQLLGVIVTKI